MKPQMTPRRSQPLFESLESRLLMDATLAIQPDGPMPQDAATDAEAAIEVNADATASEDGTTSPLQTADTHVAALMTEVMTTPSYGTHSVWDDTDMVHV